MMRYFTVDGMMSGTGIRDSVGGDYLDPSSLQLSGELTGKIAFWLKRYEKAHYTGFNNPDLVEELDREGVDICRMLKSELPDVKVEYYSSAKCLRVLP